MARDVSKVVFMGSPEFAVPTLDALVAADDMDVVRVVSQPDRPKGRGKKVMVLWEHDSIHDGEIVALSAYAAVAYARPPPRLRRWQHALH